MEHGFRLIVEFNDNTETLIYEYSSERVAEGLANRYKAASFVKSVKVIEF